MNAKKIILNIFVFSILIGSFFYFYLNSNDVANAGELRLCVKGQILTNPANGSLDYSALDFNTYLTIEYPEYSCPEGYAMMPAGFNLNLLQYPTSTNLLGGGNNPGGNSNNNGSTSSTTLPGQNNPDAPGNPYSDLYNDLTGNNGSNGNNSNTGNNGSNSNNSGNNNQNGNSSGDGLAGQLGDVAGQGSGNGNSNTGNNGGGLGDVLGGGNIYTNPNGGGSGNTNNGNGNPYQVNPNPVIQVNPALASGRFETLDPNDYKYCVLLTRDMGVGATDAVTGREVSALQMYLYDRGYSDIPATGNYDQNTSLAVAKFQYRNQIEVSGVVKADLRGILKELTCIKYPVVSYVSKPVSPTPVTVKVTTGGSSNSNTTPKTTTPPKVTTPTKPVVVIPSTDNQDDVDTPTGNLSSIEGNMYLSRGNTLYFTYNTRSVRPFICLSLNNTDCTNGDNYAPITEGIMTGLYEVVNLSNFWAFSLYNSPIWGNPGDKTRIYLKDSQSSREFSIYVVNVLN